MSSNMLLKRSMGTSASMKQLVKTPMQVFGIDGRYATALYSAASKKKNLDVVDNEIQTIKGLSQTDVKFREFVRDPSLQRTVKKDCLGAISKALGFSDVSTNFLSIVAENGRIAKIDTIIRSFEQLMAAHRGEVVCEVVTAKPLDATMTKEMDAVLQSFMKTGQKLLVHKKVDPSIMGGMIVTIGDRYVDMSLRTKMQHFSEVIKGVI